MPVMPVGYYNRFQSSNGDEEVAFLASRVLQNAELNEVQALFRDRIGAIADTLFAEGAVIQGADCVVDADTGAVELTDGAVYVQGAVRPVKAATLTIPTDETVAVGVYVTDAVVTELEDPSLKDPATGTRNYQQAGAARLRKTLAWGWSRDGQTGEFFAVYQVENGVLLSNEPPPVLDGVNQALARYDRDSTGGDYVVEGLKARFLSRTGGAMTYSVDDGRARVHGWEVTVPTALRLVEDEDPDTDTINAEPHVYVDNAGAGRITLNHTPIATITAVVCTKRETVTVTHGAYTGAADALPNPSVVQIVSAVQGGTTYALGTDYKLTGGTVDWSLGGDEPAPGSSYDVTYDYLATVTPDSQDDTGFVISGALNGTQVLTDYTWKMPRIDALALDRDGRVTRIKGLSRPYDPPTPNVPTGFLRLANIALTWADDPVVHNDGLRTVSIANLESMRDAITDLYGLVAIERLERDATTRDPSTVLGIFVDPFFDNDLRDAGIAQSAAIVDGELMLPILADVHQPSDAGLAERITLDFTLEPVLEQPLRTKAMAINPYMAFPPVLADTTLVPAVDRWTEIVTVWAEATVRFTGRTSGWNRSRTQINVELLSSASASAEVLRPIELTFTLKGFGPGEELQAVFFDGLTVAPSPLS